MRRRHRGNYDAKWGTVHCYCKMLTAVAGDQILQFKVAWCCHCNLSPFIKICICFVLLYNLSLNDWSLGDLKFVSPESQCFKHNFMRFLRNKIHFSPWDQSLVHVALYSVELGPHPTESVATPIQERKKERERDESVHDMRQNFSFKLVVMPDHAFKHAFNPLTPVPPITAHDKPWPFFLFWRHHFWPKLAPSTLNFCRRKRSFQWCPDQSDRPNGALDMHKNAQKVEWKTQSKISCHYTWLLLA